MNNFADDNTIVILMYICVWHLLDSDIFQDSATIDNSCI